MKTTTTRFEWLVGKDRAQALTTKTVLLFGCGGVGSFAMEALVRSGIGRIIIVDGDEVDITNLNRQLVATYETVGMRKVDAARMRCRAIHQETEVITYDLMYTREQYPLFFTELLEKYEINFVIDAIDMMVAKLDIIEECKRLQLPQIASMGMGNKLDPTLIQIADITKTTVCPLARTFRRELKKRRITKVPVVFSTEIPRTPEKEEATSSPGSCAFVPSVAGLAIASYVIRALTGLEKPLRG